MQVGDELHPVTPPQLPKVDPLCGEAVNVMVEPEVTMSLHVPELTPPEIPQLIGGLPPLEETVPAPPPAPTTVALNVFDMGAPAGFQATWVSTQFPEVVK